MTPKASRNLFISPKGCFRGCTDKGISWLSDGFVLARTDLLKNPPAIERPLSVKALRGVLSEARTADRLRGSAKDTGKRVEGADGKDVVLVGTGLVVAGFNEAAWVTWESLGLEAELNVAGQALWFRTVRGKRALVGVLMPVRLATRWARAA